MIRLQTSKDASMVMDNILPEYEAATLMISLALCLLLGIFTYFRKILDLRGSMIAALLGFLLIGYSDFFWFLLLLFFLAIVYLVTIYRYKRKREMGLGEGGVGERGMENVLANGIIPLLIAIFSGFLEEISGGLAGFLFLMSISIATADSFASEVGVLSPIPRLITNPRETVKPGTDGGVSLLGNISAVMGSLIIGVAGFFLITDHLLTSGPHLLQAGIGVVIISMVIGFAGCQFDSLLGATLQARGYVSNNMVNFITVLVGVIVSIPIYFIFF